MSKIEELKIEAKELGVAFNANIGEVKLKEKIDAHYDAQEGDIIEPTKEDPNTETIEETEKVDTSTIKDETETVKNDEPVKPRKLTFKEKMKALEVKARKTKVITITDNDNRENNHTTTVPVNCSNEYFDLGTVRIPLNAPIEVAQGFINVLNEIKIPHHILGQDGNTKTVIRRRYSIHFEDFETE